MFPCISHNSHWHAYPYFIFLLFQSDILNCWKMFLWYVHLWCAVQIPNTCNTYTTQHATLQIKNKWFSDSFVISTTQRLFKHIGVERDKGIYGKPPQQTNIHLFDRFCYAIIRYYIKKKIDCIKKIIKTQSYKII